MLQIRLGRENDVRNGIHFISGLPRSGSTLLAALLRQNPRFHAGVTSPVGSLFSALLRQMSQENETAVFIDDDQRRRLLHACFDAYYADIHPEKLVFDTSRGWTTRLPALVELFPDLRMICCVRNPAWIADSVERLTRRNKFEPSKIFNFDPGGTVYSRADGLSSGIGMLGFAFNALREAIYGEHSDHLLLVRYETLTSNPLGTLAAIYTSSTNLCFRMTNDISSRTTQRWNSMPGSGRLGCTKSARLSGSRPGRQSCLPTCSPGSRRMCFGTTRQTCRRRFGSSDSTRASEALPGLRKCMPGREWLRNNMSASSNAIDSMSSP